MKPQLLSWDKTLYWLVLGLYSACFLSALLSGITSWDEETDYLGIRTQVAHAVEFLRFKSPNYQSIHSNLEYYGTVGLFPAWLFWFLQQSFLVGRMSLRQALYEPSAEHQLTGFFATSHLILGVEFVLISLLVVLTARFFNADRPWIAGCICLAIPSLVGHSFVNPKDLPFAFFYTAYTYFQLRRSRSTDSRWLGLSILFSGFLINQKFVAILPVFATEVILEFVRSKSLWSFRSLVAPISATFLSLLLHPASWGLLPWVYLHEAFNTFAVHEWGGCMWWGSSCVGVRSSGWSAMSYLWQWWSVKWPLLVVFLTGVQLLWIVSRLLRGDRSFLQVSSWWILLSQLCLIPLMAVIGNSNLYDADRHTLFVYPPLAVISCFGFQTLLRRTFPDLTRAFAIVLVCLLSLVLILDNLLLNPYQIAYLNESARFTHDHKTTSLDYWSVSAKESIRQAQLNGAISLSPVVDDSLGTLPLFIGLRQLAGHVKRSVSPSLRLQTRDVSAFVDLKECNKSSEVSRTLVTGHRLVLSRLWTCP